MDVRRSTLPWIRSPQLLPQAVAHRAAAVVAAVGVVEVPVEQEAAAVRAQLRLQAVQPLLEPREAAAESVQELLHFPARRRLRLQVKPLEVEEAHKLVVAVAVAQAALVAVVAVVVDWPPVEIDRARPYPASRLSMLCLPREPIRTRHSARVDRKPVPAAVSAIRC